MEVKLTMEEIKTQFLVEAIEHGRLISIGDYKKANKIHAKIEKLYIKAKLIDQLSVFEELLNDDNESVRLWSATLTLTSAPLLAEKNLEELMKLPSIVGLTAKTTLQLWKDGKLNLL